MPLTTEMLEELEVLNLYDLTNTMEGVKIHHDADPIKIDAARRLFEKGMISLIDGGYLTDRGLETAEHARALEDMLKLE